MAVQSKLLETAVKCTCQEYAHPWTSSCVNATAGILLSCIPASLRVYTVVYVLNLLMKFRIPTLLDLKRTISGILTSTFFLTTNGYGFYLYLCLFRHILGRFYFGTAAFLPSFVSSVIPMLVIERPGRRTPLALYVANVATETFWNMLEARGLVRSIPNGQVLVLGLCMTALMFMYRVGVHKSKVKDGAFKGLRIVIGKHEEGPLKSPSVTTTQTSFRKPLNFSSISGYVQLYDRLRNSKHPSCPHSSGCSTYALRGGLTPFLGGVGLQVGLKLLLNIPKIINSKMEWRKQIFNKGSLQFGLALGSFSLIFKTISCALRHTFGHDSAAFAIPAGLLGSIGLLQFPNITISTYLMWKTLHLLYSWGIKEGLLPEIKHFNVLLYATCTAILFHSAILEASSIRPSYYKFLMDISGKRVSRFNVRPFEIFGLKSQDQINAVIKKLKIDMSAPLPLFALSDL